MLCFGIKKLYHQTGLEGINYAGTCTDNQDNDCDGKIDDEDPGCEAEVSLRVIGRG